MKEIKFVDVGEGITEGHIQKYLVNDGDMVNEDQPVVQVETDKAVVNAPAPISGKIKFVAKENSDVKVGDTIAIIGTDAELSGTPAPVSTEPKVTVRKEEPKPQPAPQTQPKEVLATPAVRKLARDLGVDIKKIVGTGPDGKVLENDIRSMAQQSANQSKPVPKFSEVLEQQHGEEVERIPMSMTRKAIARNMEASWTIPRATSMELVDADALYAIVEKEKPNVLKQFNVKLTLLPYIIKAVVQTLKENPYFNASYDHETLEIIVKKYYNIGIGAEAPDGLKVAVVKGADKMSIVDIAKAIHDLGEKVRNQTISLDEMRDSTFTITNIGSLGGGFEAVPMINYPEVAILGVLMLRDMPVVKDGKIVVGKVLPISLVFDHRVVDGAEAVKFTNALKKYLEDPDFLEML